MAQVNHKRKVAIEIASDNKENENANITGKLNELFF